jgi:hypothetical protein
MHSSHQLLENQSPRDESQQGAKFQLELSRTPVIEERLFGVPSPL